MSVASHPPLALMRLGLVGLFGATRRRA